jgi:hypothetical protein
MPVIRRPTFIATGIALATLMDVTPVHGQGTLTLSQPSSTLTASGSLAGVQFMPQGLGSLTTTYTGAIKVSALDLGAATLTIDSTATALNAAVSGNWMPKANGADGSDPANYGAQLSLQVGPFLTTNVTFAIRDAVVVVSGSPTVSLTQTAPGTYTFPANQTLAFQSGALDYRDSLMLVTPGRTNLAGQSATNSPTTSATLQNLGGTNYSLSYPVDLTVNSMLTSSITATIRIQGTITAQGVIIPVPEPSLALAVSLSAGGAVVAWRRVKPTRDMRAVKPSHAE